MKLEKKIIIKAEIELLSGLLIGSSNSELSIGKVDKLVVRSPIDKLPYIPGSSIKGKMRSLYEQSTGQIGTDGKVCNKDSTDVAKLFGYVAMDGNKTQRASRIIFRDCLMTNSNKFDKTELLFTEVKAENSINRITSEANPRFFERVPRGATFNFEAIINIFTGDDENEFLEVFKRCVDLLLQDYLGMGGSRGNGQIQFNDMSFKDVSFEIFGS